jgi:hypothetical protein
MGGGLTCRAPWHRRANLAAHPGSYRRAILARIRLILVGPRRPGHCPTTSATTAKSGPTPPLAQHGLRQLRAPCSDLGRRRVGRGYGGRPRRPSHPSRRLPGPPPRSTTSLRSDSGRGNARTPDDHTGHRHLDAQTPAPDTGRLDRHVWTLDARTGHWTPNAGRGRGKGDQGTAGIRTSRAHHAERPRAGTPKVFLWTAPAALGSPCRLGVRPPASARLPLRTTRRLLGRSAAKPRLGALLSSDDYGSSVGRRSGGHPVYGDAWTSLWALCDRAC